MYNSVLCNYVIGNGCEESIELLYNRFTAPNPLKGSLESVGNNGVKEIELNNSLFPLCRSRLFVIGLPHEIKVHISLGCAANAERRKGYNFRYATHALQMRASGKIKSLSVRTNCNTSISFTSFYKSCRTSFTIYYWVTRSKEREVSTLRLHIAIHQKTF